MTEANTFMTELYWIVGILAAFFLIIILVDLIMFFNAFSHELRMLNNEIARTEGSERDYWIRKKRKLWLSLLPFVRY